MGQGASVRRHSRPALPTQTDADIWWQRQRDWFPARWEDETDKVGICLDIGDFTAGADYLRDQLATSRTKIEPGSDQELNARPIAGISRTRTGPHL